MLEVTGFRRLAKLLYGVQVSGAENIPATGGVILVANHESLFDPWILSLATPRPVRYMAKSELWNHKLVGKAVEAFGAFPVERGGGDSAAMSNAADMLRSGDVLGIFPQGTSKQLEKRPFHRGAARLALATGAPIVPIVLVGTRGAPRPWQRPRRRTLVNVGAPIYVEVARPTVTAAKALTSELELALTQ